MRKNNHFFKHVLVFTLVNLSLIQSTLSQIISNDVDLVTLYQRDIRSKTPDAIKKDNLVNYKNFIAMDLDALNLVRDELIPKNLNPKDAQQVLAVALTNPVVGLVNYDKYDPTDEGIGYCFGRAMFVHIFLASRGFDRDSIKKAFIVGNMQTPDGSTWGWHVTTIAQSINPITKQEQWLAIDPIVGKVIPVEKWYEEMLTNYSVDKKLKLYITHAGRFALTESYDHDSISSIYYHNYFNDMMRWFETNFYSQGYNRIPLREYKL